MKWLLDTNVVSESVRPNPNRNVLAWVADRPNEEVAISILTLAELHDGVVTLGEARRRVFDGWMKTHVIPSFVNRTIPLSLEILVDWIALSRLLSARGKPKVAVDLLIAATARVHDLTVVTRNVRDFANTGVVVYDPWSDKTQVMETPDA